MGDQIRCPDCGKVVGLRKCPGGDGSGRHPRRHDLPTGERCLGSYSVLEDADVKKLAPFSNEANPHG